MPDLCQMSASIQTFVEQGSRSTSWLHVLITDSSRRDDVPRDDIRKRWGVVLERIAMHLERELNIMFTGQP